jgi:hypothetical protein
MLTEIHRRETGGQVDRTKGLGPLRKSWRDRLGSSTTSTQQGVSVVANSVTQVSP